MALLFPLSQSIMSDFVPDTTYTLMTYIAYNLYMDITILTSIHCRCNADSYFIIFVCRSAAATLPQDVIDEVKEFYNQSKRDDDKHNNKSKSVAI